MWTKTFSNEIFACFTFLNIIDTLVLGEMISKEKMKVYSIKVAVNVHPPPPNFRLQSHRRHRWTWRKQYCADYTKTGNFRSTLGVQVQNFTSCLWHVGANICHHLAGDSRLEAINANTDDRVDLFFNDEITRIKRWVLLKNCCLQDTIIVSIMTRERVK